MKYLSKYLNIYKSTGWILPIVFGCVTLMASANLCDTGKEEANLQGHSVEVVNSTFKQSAPVLSETGLGWKSTGEVLP